MFVIASNLKELRALSPRKPAQKDIAVATDGQLTTQRIWGEENDAPLPAKWNAILAQAYGAACGVEMSVQQLKLLRDGQIVQFKLIDQPATVSA